jgi:periplasmic divalent cation tolerance protein
MGALLVYLTASGPAEAEAIGRRLVEKRLAACVNILGPIRSLYWWEGKIQDEAETAFIAKTRDDLVEALIAEVKAAHSYQVPCVVALPIVAGAPDFLAWIAAETRDPS